MSRLLGLSTVRVTQDLYIAPDADLDDRFFTARREGGEPWRRPRPSREQTLGAP